MSNTLLPIDPFFPKPKTFKEYAFAKSMGLDFEMPKIDTVFSIKAYINEWEMFYDEETAVAFFNAPLQFDEVSSEVEIAFEKNEPTDLMTYATFQDGTKPSDRYISNTSDELDFNAKGLIYYPTPEVDEPNKSEYIIFNIPGETDALKPQTFMEYAYGIIFTEDIVEKEKYINNFPFKHETILEKNGVSIDYRTDPGEFAETYQLFSFDGQNPAPLEDIFPDKPEGNVYVRINKNVIYVDNLPTVAIDPNTYIGTSGIDAGSSVTITLFKKVPVIVPKTPMEKYAANMLPKEIRELFVPTHSGATVEEPAINA